MLLSIPQIQKLENTGFCYSLAARPNCNRRVDMAAGVQRHCAAGIGKSVDEMGDKGRKQCQGQVEIAVEKSVDNVDNVHNLRNRKKYATAKAVIFKGIIGKSKIM